MKKYRITKTITIIVIMVVVFFKVSPPVILQHLNNAKQIEIEISTLERQLSNISKSSGVQVRDAEETIASLRKRAAGLKSQVSSRSSINRWLYTLLVCLLMLGLVLDQAIEIRKLKKRS